MESLTSRDARLLLQREVDRNFRAGPGQGAGKAHILLIGTGSRSASEQRESMGPAPFRLPSSLDPVELVGCCRSPRNPSSCSCRWPPPSVFGCWPMQPKHQSSSRFSSLPGAVATITRSKLSFSRKGSRPGSTPPSRWFTIPTPPPRRLSRSTTPPIGPRPTTSVLHDECSADVTDPAYVKRIVDAHRNGVPAVNLHCAMHSYRWGNFREAVTAGADNASWYRDARPPIDLPRAKRADRHQLRRPNAPDRHGPGELDHDQRGTLQQHPDLRIRPRDRQRQAIAAREGEGGEPAQPAKEVETVVAWTNEFGPSKTRIFSTTIGHMNDTVADERYLDLGRRRALGHGQCGADGKAANGLGR